MRESFLAWQAGARADLERELEDARAAVGNIRIR